jgi:signal transduction histidine kinase
MSGIDPSPCEARAKILLVDDQPTNLLALRAVLDDLGQELLEARSGQEALRHLLHHDFAAVLLDIEMEGLDGFETAQLIRGRERSRDTPIIFLTAFDTPDFSAEKAYALGAVDYLVKPVVPIILRAKITGFVELYKKTERLRQLERAEYERRLAEERQRWQLQRLQEEAAREKRNAEALADLDRRKDEFLALLGHELRNPLAPIRNAVALLDQADLGGSAEQARAIIDRQSRLLARLVDDLLDVSRVRHGKITLHREQVDLAAAVATAVETSRPLVEARRHHLEVTLPPGPVFLDADPARLAQVAVNLLTNAAKYTPPGGRIWLTAHTEEGRVVLRVRDTGVGIAADMLERIFEPFAQISRSLDSDSQWGLGVGLSLVKTLVEMHGGTVTATSPGPGQGAEFIVCLPLTAGEAAEVRPAAVETPASGHPLRILVVDDNEAQAESLALLLGCDGHDVRTACDGPRALEAAAAFRPQAVLLDIGMPGMDGYEAARRLRQQSSSEKMLLVALTGYGRAEDVERAHAAGFDRHLVKPAEPAEVRRLLASATAGARA